MKEKTPLQVALETRFAQNKARDETAKAVARAFQKDSRVNWRRGNSGVLDGWVLGTSQDRIFVRNYYTDKEYWIDLSDVLWVEVRGD